MANHLQPPSRLTLLYLKLVVSRVDIGEKRFGINAAARICSRGDELRAVVFPRAVRGNDIRYCSRPHDVVLEGAGLQFIGPIRISKINGRDVSTERGHENVVAKYVASLGETRYEKQQWCGQTFHGNKI